MSLLKISIRPSLAVGIVILATSLAVAGSAAAVTSIGTDILTDGVLTVNGNVNLNDVTSDTLLFGQNGATPDTVTIAGNVSITDTDWSITGAGHASLASLYSPTLRDGNGDVGLAVINSPSGSAVNYLAVQGSNATPGLWALGSDTNISMYVFPKGSGEVIISNGVTNADQFALKAQVANTTGGAKGTLTTANLTATRTWTLPDASGNLVLDGHAHSDYLPIAGGTMTGQLFLNDNDGVSGDVNLIIGDGDENGYIAFLPNSGGGSMIFKAPATMTASGYFTLPATSGSAGQYLYNNGAGNTSWETPAFAASGDNSDITSLTGLTTALSATQGGTGLSSFALGEMIYASNGTTLVKLFPNNTTTKKFLTQTGSGMSSNAPTWGGITIADLPTITSIKLPNAPQDYGAAHVTVDLSNSQASYATNLSTDGIITASSLSLTDGKITFDASTATAASGAATLNKPSGIITTESLAIASGSTYTLTVSNSMASSSSHVMVTVNDNTNSIGAPIVGRVTSGSGSFTVEIHNAGWGSGAFNGSLDVHFVVFN